MRQVRTYEDLGDHESDHRCGVCGEWDFYCACPQDQGECGHEHTAEAETGPKDYAGRTDIYLICEECGKQLRWIGTGGML